MAEEGTTIIKKVKKGGHGGHHGGAWKVAYADFVTAMMAFFLLLWLLNATTEEQKMGISNYFDPTAISRSTRSGSGGVLGGTSITVPGALKTSSSPPMISQPQVARPQAESTESISPDSDDPENIESRLGSEEDREGVVSEELLEKLLEEREAQQFAEAEEMLRQAIAESEEFGDEIDEESFQIEKTEEGLRIQLVDQEKVAFFPNGSDAMFPVTRRLLEQVAKVLSKLPNKVKITGHTDATKFPPGSRFTNWELSSARANSSRRVLESNDINPERVVSVVGMADRDPILPDDPKSPTNRRVSIVLLKQTLDDPEAVEAMQKLAEEEAEKARDSETPAQPPAAPRPGQGTGNQATPPQSSSVPGSGSQTGG